MPDLRAPENDPIVVVGAGVIGASIAHHLVRAGREVVVIDSATPGTGVTAASFAWVGIAKSPADAYAGSLRGRARPEFDRVLTEITAPIGLRPFGALTWEESEERTRSFVSDHQAAGHRMELITAHEARMREPSLRDVPDVVAYAPDDVVDHHEHCGKARGDGCDCIVIPASRADNLINRAWRQRRSSHE